MSRRLHERDGNTFGQDSLIMFSEPSELEDRMYWKQWSNTFLFCFGVLLYFVSCLTWQFHVIPPVTYICASATPMMLLGSVLTPSLVRRVLTWSSMVLCLFPFLVIPSYEDYETSDISTFSLHAASLLCFAILSEFRMSLSRMYEMKEVMFRNRIAEKLPSRQIS